MPAFDDIDLHVKRLGWVARYWLSTHLGRDSYPIPNPERNGEGYIMDKDGGALLCLRRLPMVRPGQGIRVVSCKGTPHEGTEKCASCVCAKQAIGCSHLCQWHLVCQQDHDCRLVERSGTYLQTIDAGGGGTAVGALGSGRDRVRGIQQSGRGERGVARCKGVDEGSEFSEVFGLFDEENGHNSDGDDGALQGLSAFSDHLRDAGWFREAETAEYIHALQSEAGGEPLRFTIRDVSLAHCSRAV